MPVKLYQIRLKGNKDNRKIIINYVGDNYEYERYLMVKCEEDESIFIGKSDDILTMFSLELSGVKVETSAEVISFEKAIELVKEWFPVGKKYGKIGKETHDDAMKQINKMYKSKRGK